MVRNNPNKRVDADYEEKPTAKLSIPNWTPVEDVVRARPGGPYRAAVCPGGSRLLGLDRAGPCVTRGCMTALSLAQAAYLATMAANNAMQSSSKECRDKIAKQRYPIILKELTNIGGPCQWDARNSSWTIEKSMEFRPKESDIRRRGAEHVLPAVRNRVGPVCARVIGCTPPGWPSGKNMEAMEEDLLDALYQEALPNIQNQLKKKVVAKAAAVKTEPGVDPQSARGAYAMHGSTGFDKTTTTTPAEGEAVADSLGGAALPTAPEATAVAPAEAETADPADAADAADATEAAEAAGWRAPDTRPKKWVPLGWLTWKICGPWGANAKYANSIALNPAAPADGGLSRKHQRERQQKGGEGGAEEGVDGADGGTAPAGQEGASASTKPGKKPRSGKGADDAPPQGGFNGPPADEGSLNAYLKKCEEADAESMAQFGKLLAVIQHRGDVDNLKARMELAREEDANGQEYKTLRGQLRELLGKGPPAVPAPTTGMPPAPAAPPHPASEPAAAAAQAAAASSSNN